MVNRGAERIPYEIDRPGGFRLSFRHTLCSSTDRRPINRSTVRPLISLWFHIRMTDWRGSFLFGFGRREGSGLASVLGPLGILFHWPLCQFP